MVFLVASNLTRSQRMRYLAIMWAIRRKYDCGLKTIYTVKFTLATCLAEQILFCKLNFFGLIRVSIGLDSEEILKCLLSVRILQATRYLVWIRIRVGFRKYAEFYFLPRSRNNYYYFVKEKPKGLYGSIFLLVIVHQFASSHFNILPYDNSKFYKFIFKCMVQFKH